MCGGAAAADKNGRITPRNQDRRHQSPQRIHTNPTNPFTPTRTPPLRASEGVRKPPTQPTPGTPLDTKDSFREGHPRIREGLPPDSPVLAVFGLESSDPKNPKSLPIIMDHVIADDGNDPNDDVWYYELIAGPEKTETTEKGGET